MNTKIILSISLAINVFAAGFFIGSLNKDVITNPVVEVQATETNLTSSKNNDTSSSLESNISITGLTYYAELCDGSICYTELDETVAAFQSQGYDPILNYESDSLGGHIVRSLGNKRWKTSKRRLYFSIYRKLYIYQTGF